MIGFYFKIKEPVDIGLNEFLLLWCTVYLFLSKRFGGEAVIETKSFINKIGRELQDLCRTEGARNEEN